MKTITLDEWLKMSEEDKGINYKYLSDHDKFLVRVRYTPLTVTDVTHHETSEKKEK